MPMWSCWMPVPADRKKRRWMRCGTATFPRSLRLSRTLCQDSWDEAATLRRRSREFELPSAESCRTSPRAVIRMKRSRVIVVGAGPVGVVAALASAQKGFSVILLEAEPAVDESPRAATTHPATLEMIDRLGLIGQFVAEGLVARYFQFWDRPTSTRICEFDHDLLRDETKFPFVVQTEQHKLANMGIARLRKYADSDVRFQTRATALRQDSSGVTVTIEGLNGTEQISGDFLLGADGGRSTIRKALDIEFEGYTWPEQCVVLTTLNDFQRAFDCCYRNYFADPDEWVNLFKIAGDDMKGRWRAVFPTHADETDEHALSPFAAQERLQAVFRLPEP